MTNQIEDEKYIRPDYDKVLEVFKNMSSGLSKEELDHLLYLTLQKLHAKVLQMISYEITWEHFANDDDLNKYTPKITEEYFNSLIDGRFFRHCETFEDCIGMIIDDLEQNDFLIFRLQKKN